MGYWEEKQKYEEFKERLTSPEAHLTERERERNRVYEHELSKMDNPISLFIFGFILATGGLGLGIGIGGFGVLIGIASLIFGIILASKYGKKVRENKVLAWERAVKKIPYNSGRRKR